MANDARPSSGAGVGLPAVYLLEGGLLTNNRKPRTMCGQRAVKKSRSDRLKAVHSWPCQLVATMNKPHRDQPVVGCEEQSNLWGVSSCLFSASIGELVVALSPPVSVPSCSVSHRRLNGSSTQFSGVGSVLRGSRHRNTSDQLGYTSHGCGRS
jgi:hypothetical protein